MRVIPIMDGWQMREEPLYYGKDHILSVRGADSDWYAVPSLPCDIHVPLIEAGKIPEPSIADYYLESLWITNRSWWFKKVFEVDDEAFAAAFCELSADGLDSEADIFLNGRWLGHHRSAMYPFKKDVKPWLKAGENELIIRVTPGLEHYDENDLAGIRDSVCVSGPKTHRGDRRRAFVRKPAYVYGWDWNPVIPSCGLTGEIKLSCYNKIALRGVKFTTIRCDSDYAAVRLDVELESLHPIRTPDGDINFTFSFNGEEVHSGAKQIFMNAGINYAEFEFDIAKPKLWWPNGMGSQPLYDLRVDISSFGVYQDSTEIRVGVRTITVDTEKIDDKNRYFRFIVNGNPVFAKGGNWSPADTIYARITDEQNSKLIDEAVEANFNCFRLNGTGARFPEGFFAKCDEAGILLWHDFHFSCAAYPDHLDWFRAEVAQEVDHIIRSARNHPSLALWCGANECQWTMDAENNYWAGNLIYEFPGGSTIWNRLIPEKIRLLSPEIFYLSCSPLGSDDISLEVDNINGRSGGDSHEWYCVYMHSDVDVRVDTQPYDNMPDIKFVAEYGCLGPSQKASVLKYLGCDESSVEIGNDVWTLHSNMTEIYKPTMHHAIKTYYTEKTTPSLDEYLLYAGMFQGIMLGHAIDSIRIATYNYGSLIWSFNNAWGEVGWSIVDGYCARKISYNFVRRAYAHIRLVIRNKNGNIFIYGLNDTASEERLRFGTGYVLFDGSGRQEEKREAVLPPLSKTLIATLPDKGYDLQKGAFYARPLDNESVSTAMLPAGVPKALKLTDPGLECQIIEKGPDTVSLLVTAKAFAHAVHFGFSDDILLSDEYFDMLPGESRRVTLKAETGIPKDIHIEPKSIIPE